MTLLLPEKKEKAVFDLPAILRGGKGFVARRFIGLPGRPILAEKNLPTVPSSSFTNRKCYSPQFDILYKAGGFKGLVQTFKPEIQSVELTPDDFMSHFPASFSDYQSVMPVTGLEIHTNRSNPVEKATNKAIQKVEKFPAFQNSNICIGPADFNSSIFPMTEINAKQSLATAFTSSFAIELPENETNENPMYSKRMRDSGSFTPSDFLLTTSRNCDITQKQSFKQLVSQQNIGKPLLGRHKTVGETTFCGPLNIKKFHYHPSGLNSEHQVSGFLTREFIKNLCLVYNSKLRLHDFSPARRVQASFCCSQQNNVTAINFEPAPRFFSPDSASFIRREHSARQIQVKRNSYVPFFNNFLSNETKYKDFRFDAFKTAARGFFKLKLRLARQKTSERVHSFSQILPPCRLQSFLTAGTPLKTEFRQLTIYNKPLFSDSSHAYKFIREDLIAFRQSRSAMKMLARQHRKYCLNILKRLVPSEQRYRKLIYGSASIYKHLCSLSWQALDISTTVLRPELIQSLLIRPLTFLMSVTDKNFTDICLPSDRRHAIHKSGLFLFTPAGNPIKKRRSTLRTLRFKLFPADNSAFITSSLKPLRKILPGRSGLSIKPHSKATVRFESIFLLDQSSKKAYTSHCYRGRLERFTVPDPVPVQITAGLALAIDIPGIAMPDRLPQKHFIVPSTGQISSRPYSCRMRLSPYPFGFPGFLPEIIIFKQLAKRKPLAQKFEPNVRQEVKTDFLLNNTHSRHGPLSMKKPRRWLFSELGTSEFCGNFFKLPYFTQTSKLSQPEISRKLKHPLYTLNKVATEAKDPVSLDLKIISNYSYSCQTKTASDTPAFFMRADSGNCAITMPAVRKILLRIRKIKVQRCSFESFQAQMPLSTQSMRFSHHRPGKKSAKICFSPLNFLFYQCFPDNFAHDSFKFSDKKTQHGESLFKARFRGLRFPYRPDFANFSAIKNDFRDFLDSNQTMENSFFDSARVSELDFSSDKVIHLPLNRAGFTKFPANDGYSKFCFNSVLQKEEPPTLRCEAQPIMPVKRRIEFCEYYNEKKFLTPVFKSFFRLKKVFRLNQKTFSYLAEDFLLNRYAQVMRNPDETFIKCRFSYDSPHLVIMFQNRRVQDEKIALPVLETSIISHEHCVFNCSESTMVQPAYFTPTKHFRFFPPEKPAFKQTINVFSLPDREIRDQKKFETVSRHFFPQLTSKYNIENISGFASIQSEIVKPGFVGINSCFLHNFPEQDTALIDTRRHNYSLSLTSSHNHELNIRPFDSGLHEYREPYLPEWQDMSSRPDLMPVREQF